MISHVALRPVEGCSQGGQWQDASRSMACSGPTMPVTSGDRRMRDGSRAGNRGAGRRIRAHARSRPLSAGQKGGQHLAPRLAGITIDHRPPALPHQARATLGSPDRSASGPAQLWGVVPHQGAQPDRGTPHGKMVLAMAVGGRTRGGRIVQRLARLLGTLPPRPA